MSANVRAFLISASILFYSGVSSAFPVIDVLGPINASNMVGGVSAAIESATAKKTANADSNTGKKIQNNNENTKKILELEIENTKKTMDQALFFAKYPAEWIKLSKEYANVGNGWTTGSASKAATNNTVKAFDKIRVNNFSFNTLSVFYSSESGKFATANDVYQKILDAKIDSASAYAALVEAYGAQLEDRQKRLQYIEEMRAQAEHQRDYDMLGVLLAMEQEIGENQRMAFEMNRDAIRESTAATGEALVMQRIAQFTDSRNAAPRPVQATVPVSIQRISFNN